MRTVEETAELIKRRRCQILVHSCLYYHMDTSFISDHQYDTWSRELVVLTEENPEIAEKVVHHDAFKDFEGSTGAFLPYMMDEIVRASERLIMQRRTGRI